MQLELVSWNGNLLSTNYYGWLIHPKPLRLGGNANFLEVAGTSAQLTGVSFGGGYLSIQIRYEDALTNQHIREEEIKRWFNTFDSTPHKLIVKDTSDGNRLWYVEAIPLSLVPENNSVIIVMALDKPYWHVDTASSGTWSITTSPATKTVTCLGEKAAPILRITPGTAKGAGYMYYRFVEVAPPSTTKALPNYPLNLGAFNTSALVASGKCQASGADFRVLVGGVETPRWFGSSTGAFDTTVTNIWTVLDWKAAITLPLAVAIDDTTSIAEIAFTITKANSAAFARLPVVGIIKIVTGGNTEYFTYTGKDTAKAKVTGVVRAAKLSAKIAHAKADVCTWIQYDIWYVYGNAVVAAPEYDDSHKPIIDLDASSNTSWVYTQFREDGKQRAGALKESLLSSVLKASAPYMGSHGADADPATEAGLRAATAKVNNVEKAETVAQVWTLNCPAGITSITSLTGAKYRGSTTFPALTIQKSLDGAKYAVAQTIASPTAALTWETFTVTSLSLAGSYPFLKFSQAGALAAGAGNEAMGEIQGWTLAIDATAVPVVSVKTEYGTYYLETKISNTTTGEAIYVSYPMKLSDTLTVDCSKRRVTYSDGSRAQAAIRLDSERVDWLNLTYGSNVLQWEDAGTLGVDVGLEWTDKVAT